VSAEQGLFYVLAAGLLASGLFMILARNVVHAVLAMVVNFAVTGALYLLLHAPFLAIIQITIYAGAIMVLFLFVVMILGKRDVALDEPLAGQRLLGVAGVLLLGFVLVWATATGNALPKPPAATVPDAFGSAQAMGAVLFTQFVLPFEVVSVLLLVAVIGAVVIGRFRGEVRGIGSTEPDTEGDG
jgi:NADH-quinone oxidoreductase subunit J